MLGSDVLDLYAGSGALGIEALSRGAARAVFVDVEKAAIEALSRNYIRTTYVTTVHDATCC